MKSFIHKAVPALAAGAVLAVGIGYPAAAQYDEGSAGAPSVSGNPYLQPTRFAPAPAARSTVVRGATFNITVNKASTARVAIERKVSPTRYVPRAVLNFDLVAGRQSIPFSGRVNGRALAVGLYRARIVAIDAAGNRSETETTYFRILPG